MSVGQIKYFLTKPSRVNVVMKMVVMMNEVGKIK